MGKIEKLGKQIIKNNSAIELKTQIITNGSSYYHSHDYYEFFYMLSGSVPHYYNNLTETIKSGDLFLLRPEYVHCFLPSKISYSHRDIMVSKRLWEETCSFFKISALFESFPVKISLTNDDILEFENLINTFTNTTNLYPDDKDNPYVYLIVSQIVKLLLSDNTLLEKQKTTPPWIIPLIDFLSLPENFTKKQKQFLSQFHYSQEHICRVFKKYTGSTLTEYINNKRLDYAAVLLTSTNNTIQQILFECGFESTPYFVRKFTEKFHTTPSKFRREQLKT